MAEQIRRNYCTASGVKRFKLLRIYSIPRTRACYGRLNIYIYSSFAFEHIIRVQWKFGTIQRQQCLSPYSGPASSTRCKHFAAFHIRRNAIVLRENVRIRGGLLGKLYCMRIYSSPKIVITTYRVVNNVYSFKKPINNKLR